MHEITIIIWFVQSRITVAWLYGTLLSILSCVTPHVTMGTDQKPDSFKCKQPLEVIAKVNSCLSDIRRWMITNKLKINYSKTEFIVVRSPQLRCDLGSSSVLLLRVIKLVFSIFPRISLLYRWTCWGHPMSRAVQEGCIASCVRCSLLPDRTHKSYLLRYYRHLCLCSLVHVNPMISRFRYLHVVHGLSNPLAKLSSMLTMALCGIACSLLSHALHRITLGGKSAGFTTTQETVPRL